MPAARLGLMWCGVGADGRANVSASLSVSKPDSHDDGVEEKEEVVVEAPAAATGNTRASERRRLVLLAVVNGAALATSDGHKLSRPLEPCDELVLLEELDDDKKDSSQSRLVSRIVDKGTWAPLGRNAANCETPTSSSGSSRMLSVDALGPTDAAADAVALGAGGAGSSNTTKSSAGRASNVVGMSANP